VSYDTVAVGPQEGQGETADASSAVAAAVAAAEVASSGAASLGTASIGLIRDDGMDSLPQEGKPLTSRFVTKRNF
jgi:hypothetical protein